MQLNLLSITQNQIGSIKKFFHLQNVFVIWNSLTDDIVVALIIINLLSNLRQFVYLTFLRGMHGNKSMDLYGPSHICASI